METQDTEKKFSAKELLSRSLQDLNAEKETGDVAAVAAALKCTTRTVEIYLSGRIDNINTAKNVYSELKKIICKRDKDIKKMVA